MSTLNRRDVIDDTVYGKYEEYSQRDVAEAYRNLFDSDSEAAKIVLQDLVGFVGFGTTGVNIDSNQAYFAQGLKTVIQHIKNQINRDVYLDEQDDIAE